MRDGFLINQYKQQAANIATIYNQLKFLDYRMQAFELVLENRWDMLKAIWNPKGFKKAVDEMQIYLMHKHEQDVKDAVQKAQAEANKPKLTIVGANGFKGVAVVLIAFFLLSAMLAIVQSCKRLSASLRQRWNGQVAPAAMHSWVQRALR